MNLHKTEVEIVHNAYHQLWQQMQTKLLLKRLLRSPEHALRVTTKKPSHRHITPSL